jgi:hypothetical protein
MLRLKLSDRCLVFADQADARLSWAEINKIAADPVGSGLLPPKFDIAAANFQRTVIPFIEYPIGQGGILVFDAEPPERILAEVPLRNFFSLDTFRGRLNEAYCGDHITVSIIPIAARPVPAVEWRWLAKDTLSKIQFDHVDRDHIPGRVGLFFESLAKWKLKMVEEVTALLSQSGLAKDPRLEETPFEQPRIDGWGKTVWQNLISYIPVSDSVTINLSLAAYVGLTLENKGARHCRAITSVAACSPNLWPGVKKGKRLPHRVGIEEFFQSEPNRANQTTA